MAEALQIEGLREFQRSLKALDRELPKALRMAFNDAADIVVGDAKPTVARRRGRAQGSMRARSTQTAARISAGGSRAPYYPWLDFGGRVGRRHQTKRPFLPRGRYLYAAYDRRRDDFVVGMQDALVTVARSAGLEVT